MDIVTGAYNNIALDSIRSFDHGSDETEWNESAIVKVCQLDDAKAREGFRQIRHRDSVCVYQDDVSLDKHRIARHESECADTADQLEEASSADFLHIELEDQGSLDSVMKE